MLVGLRRHEHLDGRDLRVRACYSADGGDKDGLTILAHAVQEEHGVLDCDARKGVTEHATQKRLQVRVPVGDPIEKAKPQSWPLIRNSRACDFRAECIAALFTDFPRLQVDETAWCV